MYILLATHYGSTAPASVHRSLEGARRAVREWAEVNDADVSISGDSAHTKREDRTYVRIFFVEAEE